MSYLSEVEPFALEAYLGANDWAPEAADERRSIWRHANSDVRVFVPRQKDVDYEGLIARVLRDISRVDERERSDIALDVIWYRFDKLFVRRPAPLSGLPILGALDLHEAAHDAIQSAAQASHDHRRFFAGGRRPAQVDDFMDQVRVIPAVRGSFVVRALLPIAPASDDEALPMVSPASSDTRAVAITLLEASATAVATAQRVARGEPLTTWDDAVSMGVSANLCDALARIPGDESEVEGSAELRVDWTWARPSDVPTSVEIPIGLAPVLVAGSSYLRDEPDEFSVRLTGLVTRLHREEASGPGEVTVRGYLEGFDTRARTLRLELDEATYRSAIAAHDSGTTVVATALVRRTPRGLATIRTEGFVIVAAPA